MFKTLKELSEIVNGELKGEGNIKIFSCANLDEAKEGSLSYFSKISQEPLAQKSLASAFIVPKEVSDFPKPIILVKNPRLSFAKIMEIFAPKRIIEKGIHPQAFLGKEVKLGKDVSISAFSYISDKVKIGDRVLIYPQVYIGEETEIGEGTIIYPQVVIRERTIIGKKVIIHSGVVIGSDGFGYEKDEKGINYKIPQIGTIIIEDDVEIGANCCIDRATLGTTKISQNTKLDNLVQIGHNVKIGKNCIIVGLVGIGGSTNISENVTIAGQAGISDHINIGKNSVIAGQSGVTKNIPENSIYSGYPAAPHSEQKKLLFYYRKLPELFERLKKLENKY